MVSTTPALVQVERAGLLDDPSYLARLDDNYPLRRNEHVFAFSAAAAASKTPQLLNAVVAPGGVADVGAHLYHLTTGTLDRITTGCRPICPYSSTLTAAGDTHA